MKTLKVIGNCCLVFLAVIGVCVSIAFGYYHFFVNDTTTGTNYVGNQIGLDIVSAENLTDEEIDEYEDRWFLEANFYSNSKNNGIALQELNLNYFTDYTLTSDKYRSTGMQYLGDLTPDDLYSGNVASEDEANSFVNSGFIYYDTTDGISYDGNKISTQLNRNATFVIKIDNRAFQIQLTGSYTTTTGWWIFSRTITHYYTYAAVFADCMQAIRTNSAGYGDYYITVDLSEYFTIKEYDTSTGKYKADDVTDLIKNYAVLKFHYDENGAVNATQSIFGQIECDRSYGIDESINTDYWQAKTVYDLTENSTYLNENIFNFRYSEVYKGYFISLNMDVIELFNEINRKTVNLTLTLTSDYLTSKDINIIGIDYNGFEDFEINTLKIVGNTQTFYLLDSSLKNTKLQTLTHSSGITLDIAENAINSEYVEVVL